MASLPERLVYHNPQASLTDLATPTLLATEPIAGRLVGDRFCRVAAVPVVAVLARVGPPIRGCANFGRARTPPAALLLRSSFCIECSLTMVVLPFLADVVFCSPLFADEFRETSFLTTVRLVICSEPIVLSACSGFWFSFSPASTDDPPVYRTTSK